jgi:hypothetical protein
MHTIILWIVFANGVYDILCALSILGFMNIPILNKLHVSIITYHANNHLFERFFAYWIFTYGIIRISGNMLLITASYAVEALCILNEYRLGTIDPARGAFVIISSLFLAYIVSKQM